MRDLLGWSISLGRWSGVRVRLHAFFLIAAALILFLCSRSADSSALLYGLSAILILLVSVGIHEWAHCVAVYRMGAQPDQVVLWPFGGLVVARSYHDLPSEIAASAAGPLANLLVAIASLPFALSTAAGWGELLNPLRPPLFEHAFTWRVILAQVFWINFALVWVNLLPAPPTDMARVVRAATRESLGIRRSLRLTVRLGRLIGLALLLVAWVLYEPQGAVWFPVSLLGIFFFFSARDEIARIGGQDSEDEPFGYDFSQGYTSLDKSFDAPSTASRPIGTLRRWLQQRREAREARRRKLEEDEDRRVDEILSRMSDAGLDSLTAEERSLLQRVSHRYRNRLGQ